MITIYIYYYVYYWTSLVVLYTRLRLKLHQCDLSWICCGFFVKHVKNKLHQWSFSIIVHVLKAGSCRSVYAAKCCQYRQMLPPDDVVCAV